jgi:hypothetical protein
MLIAFLAAKAWNRLSRTGRRRQIGGSAGKYGVAPRPPYA